MIANNVKQMLHAYQSFRKENVEIFAREVASLVTRIKKLFAHEKLQGKDMFRSIKYDKHHLRGSMKGI